MKKVLVICGTGVATSTVVAVKIREYLEAQGIPVAITQGKVMDIVRGIEGYDLIVATTPIPDSVKIPVIQGISFLTGIGNEKTLNDIADALR
ncbi:MAG: PTS sugar transporter subunit IIB [Rhodoluna sp.]|jgi:PTS system galactitol-specific IIB component